MATSASTDAPPTGRRRPRVAGATLALIGLYLLAVAVYVALGTLRDVPLFNPDEFLYGGLAQSLADGDGLTWRGEPQRLVSLLYVLLITPAWWFGSTVGGYAAAKVISVVVLCTVAFPVFLLVRELLTPGLALLAAAVTLAGSWMMTSSLLLTENLAFPLTTAALCATVMLLREPGSRWLWVALGLAVAATLARVQVVVVFPIILLALAVDAGRHWPDWRARAEQHRLALIVTGAISGVLLLVQLADPNLLGGSYYKTVGEFPLSGGVLSAAVRQWIVLVAMAVAVPVVLTVAAACSPRAWRDEQLGPVLAVTVTATLVFVLETGWFLNGLEIEFSIQRYVEYVVPMFIVCMLVVAARREFVQPWAYAVVVAVALLALLGAELFIGEQWTAGAMGEIGDYAGLSRWQSVAVATFVLGLLAVWLVRRLGSSSTSRAPLAVGLLTGAVLVLLSANTWHRFLTIDSKWHSGFPSDLRWLDKAAGTPVSRLVITASHPRWPTIELFNRKVDRVYALETATRKLERGRICTWTADAGGQALFEPGCGAPPRRLYIDDPAAHVTFAGQRLIKFERGAGRLIEIPGPAMPKLESLLVLPCDDSTLLRRNGELMSYFARECRTVTSGYFWLERPATLVLGVRGGNRRHPARVRSNTAADGKAFSIEPRRLNTLRIPVPAGGSQLQMRFDTLELPRGLPEIVSAALETGGEQHSIL
jgi:uncharacterized membrane protein YjdF